jgi:Domain of unknown function (DUF4476)
MADESIKERGNIDAGLIPEKDLKNLIEQLERMHRDVDRIRLINAAADGGWRFNVDQLWTLIELQHFGDAKNFTAIKIYPYLVDKERFQEVLVDELYYNEDIVAIKKELNLS